MQLHLADLVRLLAAGLVRQAATLSCIEVGSGGAVTRALTSQAGASRFLVGALILSPVPAQWPTALLGETAVWAAVEEMESPAARLACRAQALFGTTWGLGVVVSQEREQWHVQVGLAGVKGVCLEIRGDTAGGREALGTPLVEYVLSWVIQEVERTHGSGDP